MGFVSSKNSTIVRTKKAAGAFQLEALRAGLAVLSPRAPQLAARWAEGIFLTARRRRRPAWEAAALAGATRSEVVVEGGTVPVWSWSPPGGRAEAPRTVLLVHGWEGRGAQLAAFVPGLLEQGFRVVTFDGPGHGESTLKHASVVDHARGVLAVARAMGGVHAVVGHSVGGAATLLATRFGLRAERIAILGAPRAPFTWARSFKSYLHLDDEVFQAMIALLEERYGIAFPELDVVPDAKRLGAPLLVVHDEEDKVVDALDGIALAAAAPASRFLVTKGLGHQRILRSPRVVADVTAFVAEDTCAPTLQETLDGELFYRDTRW